MESSKTAQQSLELEILQKAQSKPLFSTFNADDVEKYFRLLLSMKTQTHCLASSRDPKDIAILFKRF